MSRINSIVTEKTVFDFQRDGAICLRNIIDLDCVKTLQDEIEIFLQAKGSKGFNYTNHTSANGNQNGAFISIGRLWIDSTVLSNFTHNSMLPQIAALLTESNQMNLYFDQCFVKEPGTSDPTPWHNDQPYWPLKGNQVITIWLALDDIPKQNGAVEFVKGSHQWQSMFQPQPFNQKSQLEKNPEYRKMIDVEKNRDQLEIISWDMKAGDVLAFYGMTLHGSKGNTDSGARRRGYSIRYTGSDVVYDPKPGNTPALIRKKLAVGQPITSIEYPLVWT